MPYNNNNNNNNDNKSLISKRNNNSLGNPALNLCASPNKATANSIYLANKQLIYHQENRSTTNNNAPRHHAIMRFDYI